MKFIQLLYQTDMVEAVIDQRKSMTRRTRGLKYLNEFPNDWVFDSFDGRFYIFQNLTNTKKHFAAKCPYGQVGDVLWVREKFRPLYNCETGELERFDYFAGNQDFYGYLKYKGTVVKWKPSLFMPKEACRIFLKVKSIRIERLYDITKEDAIAEGVECKIINNIKEYRAYLVKDSEHVFGKDSYPISAECSFLELWEKINGNESVNLNPWVWVIEFERIDKPENFLS